MGGAICAVGSAFGALGNLVHGGYQLVLGDDVDTLLNSNSSGLDKFFAVVDIASNAVVIIPGVGEGIEAAKLAEEAGFAARKVAVRVLDKEDVRLLINKAKRTAVETLETGAEACSLCFPAGTLVATPAGERAIQTLYVGERVLAEDPQSGQVEPEPVQAVIQDSVAPLIAVELSDGSAITVTADHPFWLDVDAALGIGGWVPAGQLHAGDRLRTADGADVQVIGLQRGVGHAAVFTLTVAHDHTFFVGSARVLVHNANCFQTVAQAVRALINGAQEVTVETRQEAEEVFYKLYANRFHNTTGSIATEVKNTFGTKAGTYHWDVDVDEAGRVIGHAENNPHGSLPHVQIHDLEGDVIRIFFAR